MVERCIWDVIDLHRCSPDLASSDLHLSGSVVGLVITGIGNCVIWKLCYMETFASVRLLGRDHLSPETYPGILFGGGGGSTNSVQDRENWDLGAVVP